MDMLPQLLPHPGNRIRKRGAGFAIPCRAAHTCRSFFAQQMRSQCNDRVEAQQRRSGTGNSLIIPLALRFHPQMGPRFFPRDFHRPATHKPGQYLCAGLLQIGRQQGLWFEALLRVANQDPAESHRRLARVIPDRRVRGDVDLTGAFPIPIINRQRAPLRLLVCQHCLQGRPAFPFEAGPPFGPRGTVGRGIIEGRVQTQPRDHTDMGQPCHQGEPFQGRKTAVRHEDQLAVRPPAPHDPNALPGAFQQGLVMAATLCIEALGGTQHRQKGQGPDPVGPCYGGQQHTPKPAQATGFDHMRVRGPHGITVDTFGGDLFAASAFAGVIKAKDDDTAGDEHRHEEPEEQPTRGERRPAGTIEDTMIRLKVGRCAASHNPENRRDRPLSWSKDGAGHEDFHVLPNGSRKDRGKDPNSTAKGDRQGDHGHPFRMKRIWLSLPINCDSNCDNWIKSSLEAILLYEPFRSVLPRQGVHIIGAWFQEPLDLAYATLVHRLALEGSRFEADVDLTALRTSDIVDLSGSTVLGTLHMPGLHTSSVLFMGKEATFTTINLVDAKVDGRIDLSTATVTGHLDMNGLHVSGVLFMNDKATFATVDLMNAKVDGVLDLSAATVTGKLDMNGLHVGAGLFMNDKATFATVDLGSAK